MRRDRLTLPPAHLLRRPWVADLAWALAETAIALGLLLFLGGVGAHLNALDLPAALLPKYELAGQALLDLRLPLWNPWEFCGMPLFASMQGAFLHPPTAILFALFESFTALQALYALHSLILFWGLTAYLRRHGLPRVTGALAGAIVWSAHFLGPGGDHASHLAALSMVPALFVCLENAFAAPSPRATGRWVTAAGFLYALAWLAGYPDYPLDIAVVVMILGAIGGPRTLFARTALALSALALGTMLASVQLLPTLEMARESAREEYAHRLPDLRALFALISSPSQLGEILLRSYGGAALVLGGIGLASRRRITAAWLLVFLWGMLPANPPFVALYSLPVFSATRVLIAWRDLAGLALGMLAAMGFAVLWRARRLRPVALLLLGGVFVHAAILMMGLPERFHRTASDPDLVAARAAILRDAQSSLPDQPRVLSAQERLAGAMIRSRLFSVNGYEPSMLEPARVGHLTASLGLVFGSYDWKTVAKRRDLAARLGLGLVVVSERRARELEHVGFGRLRALEPADVQRRGVPEQAGGERGGAPEQAGVRRGGAREPRDVLLYRESVPRARLVHRVIPVADAKAALEWVAERSGDAPDAVALEQSESPPTLALPAPGVQEEVTMVRDDPERVDVRVRAAAPGLLILRDTHYPGWRAAVDGAPADILAADYAFRAVAVPAGEHLVSFEYAPASLRFGLALSGLGALVAVCLCMLPARSSGRAGP